jgi:hypothetical protein
MSAATLALLLQSLPLLIQTAGMAINGLSELTGIMQKAQDEGRDLTVDEKSRVDMLQSAAAAFNDALVAQWMNRIHPPPPP